MDPTLKKLAVTEAKHALGGSGKHATATTGALAPPNDLAVRQGTVLH